MKKINTINILEILTIICALFILVSCVANINYSKSRSGADRQTITNSANLTEDSLKKIKEFLKDDKDNNANKEEKEEKEEQEQKTGNFK